MLNVAYKIAAVAALAVSFAGTAIRTAVFTRKCEKAKCRTPRR